MTSRINSRVVSIIAAAVVLALVAVVVVSRVSSLTNGSTSGRDASATSVATSSPKGSASPGSASPGSATPGSATPGATTAGGGAGAPGGPGAPGGGSNPGGGTVAAYAFAPQPAGSGAAPSTQLVASDMVPSGQQLVASFVMGSPGTVSLHAFPAGAGTYDTSGVRACLEFAGQAPCGPAPFPNPAYWTVSANDLAHHSGYQLRVAAPASGGPLLGLDVGWNGSHHLALSGLSLPGTCSAASAGYTAGCGVRFKFSAAGTATISAGPGLLHLKVRDKATGTVACNVKFSGSTPCALDHAAQWTGDLYPEAGGRISPVSLTVDWP